MYSFKLLVTFFLGVYLSQSIIVAGMKQPKCRGQTIKLSEEDMKIMTDCTKEIAPNMEGKPPSAIPKEKMACLGKCMMTKEGMIDDKGMPNKENLITKMNATMPQEVMEEMDSAIEKCVDQHGKAVDPADATCQSYQGLTQCISVAFIEVCKEKKA